MNFLGINLSLKYLLNFCQTCFCHHVSVNFEIDGVKITWKCICDYLKMHLWLKVLYLFIFESIESIHASKQYSLQVLIFIPQAERNYPFLPGSIFENYFSPSRKGGEKETVELKKWSKLNLWGYWLQILLNLTFFVAFTFFGFGFVVP